MGTLNSNYLKKWKLAVILVYILVYFLAYPIFIGCCKKLKMSRLAVTKPNRNLFLVRDRGVSRFYRYSHFVPLPICLFTSIVLYLRYGSSEVEKQSS